jgi:hypothetical protein
MLHKRTVFSPSWVNISFWRCLLLWGSYLACILFRGTKGNLYHEPPHVIDLRVTREWRYTTHYGTPLFFKWIAWGPLILYINYSDMPTRRRGYHHRTGRSSTVLPHLKKPSVREWSRNSMKRRTHPGHFVTNVPDLCSNDHTKTSVLLNEIWVHHWA